MKYSVYLLCAMLLAGISSCRKSSSPAQEAKQEDLAAKKMLQGIWVDEDEQDVAFKAKGDTIFYPDSTSQPVYFQIIDDTLVLHGANVAKYPVVKQTAHLFVFRNQNGDEVRCVLSDDPDDATFFSSRRPLPINQNQVIKRDTVIDYNGERYHCYVQVNPTTYKVTAPSYNDDGVEVDNVYYDNIINLNVFHGAQKLFGGDFKKQQFTKRVPSQFLNGSILSDLTFDHCDEKGIHYTASLIKPGDSMGSYQVDVTVSYKGHLEIESK
jgi:hypothetical protein